MTARTRLTFDQRLRAAMLAAEVSDQWFDPERMVAFLLGDLNHGPAERLSTLSFVLAALGLQFKPQAGASGAIEIAQTIEAWLTAPSIEPLPFDRAQMTTRADREAHDARGDYIPRPARRFKP